MSRLVRQTRRLLGNYTDYVYKIHKDCVMRLAQWIETARSAGPELNATTYADLAKPTAAVAPFTYRSVAPGLFETITVSELQSDDALCRKYPSFMRAEK